MEWTQGSHVMLHVKRPVWGGWECGDVWCQVQAPPHTLIQDQDRSLPVSTCWSQWAECGMDLHSVPKPCTLCSAQMARTKGTLTLPRLDPGRPQPLGYSQPLLLLSLLDLASECRWVWSVKACWYHCL